MMKHYILPAAALVLSACVQSGSVQTSNETQTPETKAETVTHVPADNYAQGNTRMGVDLYQKLRETVDGNIFISPLSLSSASGMVYAGAKGETAAQMAAVMHYPASGVHAQIGALQSEINAINIPAMDTHNAEVPLKVSINNSVWVDKLVALRPDFTRVLDQTYMSEINRVNFREDAGGATEDINRWVEDKTEDRIKDLIPPKVLNALTRLVLVNTVYMKTQWLSTFDEKLTQPRPFKIGGEEAVDIKIMEREGKYQRARIGKAEAINLPYFGNELSMVVILPDKDKGLPALEANLTAASVNQLFSDLDTAEFTQTELRLPAFKAEESYKLTAPLKALGMVDAFDKDAADFSGIDGGEEPLVISEILQKTFLEVNEKGTEAAAATAIIMVVTSAGPLPPKPKDFHVDHPFMLLIRHNESGAVIFMGGINDPREVE